jgi:hypothetical protein
METAEDCADASFNRLLFFLQSGKVQSMKKCYEEDHQYRCGEFVQNESKHVHNGSHGFFYKGMMETQQMDDSKDLRSLNRNPRIREGWLWQNTGLL